MKHNASLLVVGLAVLAPSIARADTFFEFGGGLILPVSDDDYADFVDPSVGLAARIGGGGPVLGGMFSLEWAPLPADPDGFSLNRFRMIGHVVVHRALNPKTELVGRFGAGLDIMHSSFRATAGPFRVEGSDTDIGVGLEFGGGVWFRVGSGTTQVGAEIALPIGIHNENGAAGFDPDDQRFDYTAFDLEILGGVRLRL